MTPAGKVGVMMSASREEDRVELERELQGSEYKRLLRELQLKEPFLRRFGTWLEVATFVQGFSTHNNKYDFVTLDPATIETMYSADLQKPAGANFWEWLKTAQFKI